MGRRCTCIANSAGDVPLHPKKWDISGGICSTLAVQQWALQLAPAGTLARPVRLPHGPAPFQITTDLLIGDRGGSMVSATAWARTHQARMFQL